MSDKPMSDKPKPAKKSWSNPALRAMGIPKVSLPSRNWLIFWSVLSAVGGGIYYDKRQQKKIRESYMAQVEQMGQEIYGADRLPRKLSVFIAPPPDDFLEESLRHFRKYIKPILNAAAIDFEVYTENRQGDIRADIAEKIRQMRRETAAEKAAQEQKARDDAYNRSWRKVFTEDLVSLFKRKAPEEEKYVSRHELYNTTDVLGVFKVLDPPQPKRDNSDDADKCGGVICIGRGAYKEYMAGVHEGLLGPLEKPEIPEKEKVEVEKAGNETEGKEVKALGDFQKPEEPNEEKKDEVPDFEDESDKKDPVPKPYISMKEYANGQLAPELDFSTVIRNNKQIPVIFEQPVYVFPLPKLSGFVNIPRKIFRYFTQRELAEEVSKKTMDVVHGHSRKYEYKDQFLAKEEEMDWPKKWVEKGRAKNSEWVQELEVDDRVVSRMRVFCK